MGFDGKPLKSVTQGVADLAGFALLDAGGAAAEPLRAANAATAAAFVKQILGEQVSEVRLTDRLVESPACLVASERALDRGIERILRERQGEAPTPPVLELNGTHAVVRALATKVAAGGGGDAEAAARLLFDYAQIADGEMPRDLKAFGGRLQALIEKGLA
jgi:molecular chaperone HtpG